MGDRAEGLCESTKKPAPKGAGVADDSGNRFRLEHHAELQPGGHARGKTEPVLIPVVHHVVHVELDLGFTTLDPEIITNHPVDIEAWVGVERDRLTVLVDLKLPGTIRTGTDELTLRLPLAPKTDRETLE